MDLWNAGVVTGTVAHSIRGCFTVFFILNSDAALTSPRTEAYQQCCGVRMTGLGLPDWLAVATPRLLSWLYRLMTRERPCNIVHRLPYPLRTLQAPGSLVVVDPGKPVSTVEDPALNPASYPAQAPGQQWRGRVQCGGRRRGGAVRPPAWRRQ